MAEGVEGGVDAFIVRKETAQKMKEELGKEPISIEVKPPIEVPGQKVVPERAMVRKVAYRAIVPWDKLSELVRGVFTPLSRDGAQI